MPLPKVGASASFDRRGLLSLYESPTLAARPAGPLRNGLFRPIFVRPFWGLLLTRPLATESPWPRGARLPSYGACLFYPPWTPPGAVWLSVRRLLLPRRPPPPLRKLLRRLPSARRRRRCGWQCRSCCLPLLPPVRSGRRRDRRHPGTNHQPWRLLVE